MFFTKKQKLRPEFGRSFIYICLYHCIPICSYLMILPSNPYDTILIITDARKIPRRIARDDFLISISRSDAISAPVHAPVPGSGIPTNNTSPQNSYFSILSLFPIALRSSHSIIGRNNLVFFIHLKICLMNSRINGIGRIFPIMQRGSAVRYGTCSRDAASSPPLSSRIGSSEMIKTTAVSDI